MQGPGVHDAIGGPPTPKPSHGPRSPALGLGFWGHLAPTKRYYNNNLDLLMTFCILPHAALRGKYKLNFDNIKS